MADEQPSEEKPPEKHQDRSEKQLRKIALDIADGKVFGTWMLHENETNMIGHIFMPFILGGKEFADQLIANKIAHFFEYYEKAGPRSINGYPIFWSIRCVSETESEKLQLYVQEALNFKKAFLGESDADEDGDSNQERPEHEEG